MTKELISLKKKERRSIRPKKLPKSNSRERSKSTEAKNRNIIKSDRDHSDITSEYSSHSTPKILYNIENQYDPSPRINTTTSQRMMPTKEISQSEDLGLEPMRRSQPKVSTSSPRKMKSQVFPLTKIFNDAKESKDTKDVKEKDHKTVITVFEPLDSPERQNVSLESISPPQSKRSARSSPHMIHYDSNEHKRQTPKKVSKELDPQERNRIFTIITEHKEDTRTPGKKNFKRN